MFFVTEHSRAKGLESELGKEITSLQKITDKKLNNKFAIFKAEFATNTSTQQAEEPESQEQEDG